MALSAGDADIPGVADQIVLHGKIAQQRAEGDVSYAILLYGEFGRADAGPVTLHFEHRAPGR